MWVKKSTVAWAELTVTEPISTLLPEVDATPAAVTKAVVASLVVLSPGTRSGPMACR